MHTPENAFLTLAVQSRGKQLKFSLNFQRVVCLGYLYSATSPTTKRDPTMQKPVTRKRGRLACATLRTKPHNQNALPARTAYGYLKKK